MYLKNFAFMCDRGDITRYADFARGFAFPGNNKRTGHLRCHCTS